MYVIRLQTGFQKSAALCLSYVWLSCSFFSFSMLDKKLVLYTCQSNNVYKLLIIIRRIGKKGVKYHQGQF